MKMRLFVLLSLSATVALAAPKEVNCTGTAENDSVVIENLQATKNKIALSYTKDGEKFFKGFRTRAIRPSPGGYQIEGSNENFQNISSPQAGKMVFEHKGQKIVAAVSCTQK